MEGPSLVILREELAKFKGKKIIEASGLSKIDYSKLIGKKINSFQTWGKHFLIVLKDVTIRIHFLMFGSYRVNETKETKPRLHLLVLYLFFYQSCFFRAPTRATIVLGKHMRKI